jgi:hypothetical protein
MIFFFLGRNTGQWIQGLRIARQALYHLNHAPVFFALVCFQIVLRLLLRLASDLPPSM